MTIQNRKGRNLFLVGLLSVLLVFAGFAAAQTVHVDEADLPDVGLASFSVSGGFPGYQLFSAGASLQYGAFGIAARVAPTAAGLFVGGSARYYPPLPVPVPIYISIGGGIYGESGALHLTTGAHIPVSEQLRIDLEAGASRVSSFGMSQWLPLISGGLSWVIPVELGGTEAARNRAGLGTAGSAQPVCGPPDEAALHGAMDSAVSAFVRNARATYAGTYSELSYWYEVISTEVSGDSGSATIRYEGSVRVILTGEVESATGTASAGFIWTGCSWQRTSIDY